MYDPGFPFLRSWLYGIGGFVVVVASFAVGFVLANRERPSAAKMEAAAAVATDRAPDDVIVARAVADSPRFPAFAPEGVIVVHPVSQEERPLAVAETVRERPAVERARSGRRAEASQRPAPSNVARPPVTVATSDSDSEEADLDANLHEPRDVGGPTRNESPPVQEYEEEEDYAEREMIDEPDSRSWYGSAEYRRELAERRRVEREARRRRNW